jgi:hypothetical protein
MTCVQVAVDTVVDFCEQCNKLSGSIKGGEFLGQLSDC